MTTPTFLPSCTPITHIPWVQSDTLDAHNNPTGSYGDPVSTTCICWWPEHWRTGRPDPVSADTMDRIATDIHMLVTDPTLYSKRDMVIVDGLTYQVQGLETDWKNGLPFPNMSYSMLTGGEVHCRRVTSTGVLAGQ
jgi:hypothetical protein